MVGGGENAGSLLCLISVDGPLCVFYQDVFFHMSFCPLGFFINYFGIVPVCLMVFFGGMVSKGGLVDGVL